MQSRINIGKAAPGVYQAMMGLGTYLHQSGLELSLIDLIALRASQINGCAYCIDMHWKDLRAGGENEQRLYGLDAWRESPYYTDRERAALAWTEAVTRVGHALAPLRRHAGPGPRVQAGLLYGHLVRRRPDRPAARHDGPAEAVGQHGRRLLERPRIPPGRARALDEAEPVRRVVEGAFENPRRVGQPGNRRIVRDK